MKIWLAPRPLRSSHQPYDVEKQPLGFPQTTLTPATRWSSRCPASSVVGPSPVQSSTKQRSRTIILHVRDAFGLPPQNPLSFLLTRTGIGSTGTRPSRLPRKRSRTWFSTRGSALSGVATRNDRCRANKPLIIAPWEAYVSFEAATYHCEICSISHTDAASLASKKVCSSCSVPRT